MKEHDELPTNHSDPFIGVLNRTIKYLVKVLAILMVFVIFLATVDVIFVLYNKLSEPPYFLLELTDVFKVFAVFLAALIAIEIYQNIILYLRTDVIPISLVIATALMAIARKVIIIDFNEVSPMYIFATAAVVLALGITYYLVGIHHKDEFRSS